MMGAISFALYVGEPQVAVWGQWSKFTSKWRIQSLFQYFFLHFGDNHQSIQYVLSLINPLACMRQKNQTKIPIQLDFIDCQSMAEFGLLLILSTIECTLIRKLQSIRIPKNELLLDFLVQKCRITIFEMILGNFETFLVSSLALNSFQRGRDFLDFGGFLSPNRG